MTGEIEPQWPKILRHSAHEFRTPLSVVTGYIGMVLRGMGGGTLTDNQRRMLEEAAKSCKRLAALADEVSELAKLEAGTISINKQAIDLNAVLRTAVGRIPPLPDREVAIDLQTVEERAPIKGDPVKLAEALGAIIVALRRELVTSDRLVVRALRTGRTGSPSYDILVGDEATVESLAAEPAGPDSAFDLCRGGVGLSLFIARRILDAHGGAVHSPAIEGYASARILLPGS